VLPAIPLLLLLVPTGVLLLPLLLLRVGWPTAHPCRCRRYHYQAQPGAQTLRQRHCPLAVRVWKAAAPHCHSH